MRVDIALQEMNKLSQLGITEIIDTSNTSMV